MGITEDFDMAERAPDEVLAKAIRDPMSSPISQIAALSALKQRQMLRTEMAAAAPQGKTVADRALSPQGYAHGGVVKFDKGGSTGPTRAEIESHAAMMADKYGVPRDYMMRLIQKESSFNPNARGPLIEKFKGTRDQHAYGLGQLLPSTAESLGVDYRDWKQNLEGSAKYSRQMYDRYKDWNSAAYAYNAGPGNADKGRGIRGAREYADFVAGGGGGAPQGQASGQAPGQAVDFEALRAMLEGIETPQLAPQGARERSPMPDLEGLMQTYQPAFADTGEDDEMMASMSKEINQRKKQFQNARPEFAGFSEGGPVRGPTGMYDPEYEQWLAEQKYRRMMATDPNFPITDSPVPFNTGLRATDKPLRFGPFEELGPKDPFAKGDVPIKAPDMSTWGAGLKKGVKLSGAGSAGRDFADASQAFWLDSAKMAVEGIPSDEIGWSEFNQDTPGIVTAGLNIGRGALDATARFGGAMGAVGGMLGTGLGAVYDATLGSGPGTREWMTIPKDAAGTPEKKKIEVKADGKKPAQPAPAAKPSTAQTPIPPTTKVPTTDQAAQDTVTGGGGVMGDLESFVRDLMAEKEATSSRGRSEREQRLRDTAILQAGLGIASGDSPYFASNIKGAMPAIQMYQAGMDNIDQDVAAREDAYRQALIGARTGDMRMKMAREASGLETKQRIQVAEFEMKAKLEELKAKGQLTRDDFMKVVSDTYLPNQSGMAAAQMPAEFKGSLTDWIQYESNRLYNNEQILSTRRVGVADSQNGKK